MSKMRIRANRKGLRLGWAYAGGMAAAGTLWVVLHGGQAEDQTSSVKEAISIHTEDSGGITDFPTNKENQDKGDLAPPAAGGNAGSDANRANGLHPAVEDSPINVRVYLTKEQRVERVPLEEYVKGVVAAEMPTDFEPAALEAQAIAARTYLIRRLWLDDAGDMPVKGADVTDTVTHQVYRSKADMQKLKQDHSAAWAKVDKAVNETRGLVIAYQGAPIESLYFSSSNGYTENSDAVFAMQLPYLQSVSSPWDKEEAPRSKETVELSLSEFYRKLGVRTLETLTGIGKRPEVRILTWTEGRRVKEASVGSKKFTGSQIRQRLGLRSAAFDWTVVKNKIVITTYGSGHGVGMSQWGAEGMAKTGASAAEIVLHYYKGVELQEVSKLHSAASKL